MLQEIPVFENFKSFAQIKTKDGLVDSINARELYSLMDEKIAFSTWAKKTITHALFDGDYEDPRDAIIYKKGVDYIIETVTPKIGRPRIEYKITIDTAQDVLITTPGHVGHMYRRYLIKAADQISAIHGTNSFEEMKKVMKVMKIMKENV